MQFFKDGPDVPERLLEAHEEGEVVFFCGAGISYPAGLPGFEGLVDELYGRLAPVPDPEQQAARSAKQFDTAIALLEEKHVGGREQVRETLNKILRPRTTDPKATATHKALLTLSENREGRRRLITTNFDRLFQTVMRRDKLRVTIFQAPLLPVPKTRWNGLVYLHGLLAARPDADNLNSLVLSSGDFGLAYLTERWAARFVSDLFRSFTVCFVGYSIGDPVLRYMMDALAADRQLGETPREMFAFGDHSEDDEVSQTNKWKAKNVTPILYLKDRDHSNLHRTLEAWAYTYGDGVSGKEQIVAQSTIAHPVESTQEDNFVSRVLWALSDPSGLPAKQFAEMNPVPSLEWLEPLGENLLDRSDLVRLRPASGDTGPRRSGGDEVMGHLAHWLVRHLNDPSLVLWLVEHGGQLHEWFTRHVAACIKRLIRLEAEGETAELDRIGAGAANAIPCAPMRTIWGLLLTGRVTSRVVHHSLSDWHERLAHDGLTTTLRLELRERLAPSVSLSKAFPRLPQDDEGSKPKRMRDFIEWEIVLRTEHVHSGLREIADDKSWRAAQPEMLDDFVSLLRDALDLMRELDGADDTSDSSYVHQPSISEHGQNRGFQDWTVLIGLTRDAWRATAAQSPERARLAAEAWRHIRYPLFRRLTFFAAAHPEIIPHRLGVNWLLEDKCWWLWSEETRRETIRLLVALAPQLGEAEQLELEAAVLAGPPDELLEGLEAGLCKWFRNQDIWLRLAKIAHTGATLGVEAEKRLAELSTEYPEWQLAQDERDEFAYRMHEPGELHEFVAAPDEFNELVEWLRKDRRRRAWKSDDWRERCREDFPVAVRALRTLAAQGAWPVMRWHTALHAWSEGTVVNLAWEQMAPVFDKAPTSFLSEARNVLAWWLREIARTIEWEDATFLSLCKRVLRLKYDPEEDVDDIVGRAINHPIGRVTDALLRWWHRDVIEDDQVLPQELDVIFTELCDAKVGAFRHGRVLLASRVITLFRADCKWTTQHLLPHFDWNKSELEAGAAWEGLLWSPQLYGPLLRTLKPAFLETAHHYDELGKHGRQYASVLVYASLDPRDIFSKTELATATLGLPPEGLKEAAVALIRAAEAAGDQRADYWKNRVMPYLREIWPKTRKEHSAGVAQCVGIVCIAAQDAFPATFKLLRGWLKRSNYPDQLVWRLHEEGLCERFPERALEFLHASVEDGPQLAPSELPECLRAIRSADPKLESDRRFRRLREYLRKDGKDFD